jgi:N-acetylglucosaminyl-diphospho-decaprenol L-rhamnosyltransferase
VPTATHTGRPTVPDLAIVVVSYHSAAEIEALVASLPAASQHPVVPVVADNAADPELRELAERGAIAVEDMGGNLGYGAAVNEAVRRLAERPEWLLVVNPDVIFHPGAIDELLRVARSVVGIGMVGPQILTPAGETYPSARSLPSLRTGIGHALLGKVWRRNPWTARYTADQEHPPRERLAGWLSGACFLVRMRDFDAVGGFDEKFFMYFEDVDLGARIGRLGREIVYAPSAVVEHSGGHATAQANRRMIVEHHRSAYRYLADKYPGWHLAPLRAALRVGLAVRARIVRS